MPRVTAPDGTKLNFPDTMSRAEILDVMRQKFPPAAPQPTQAAPIDSPPTLGPSTAQPATRYSPMGRIGRQLDEGASEAARQVRGFTTGALQGLTAGASDEALALADVAAGRGDISETLPARQAQLEAQPRTARTLGEVLGFAGTAGAGPAGLGPLLARSAVEGGAYGFAGTPGTVKERALGAAVTAPLSAATAGAVRGLGSMISPRSTPEVQALRGMNVPLTPGQAAGGGVRRFEEGLKSAPIVGDFIRAAERRGLGRWNVGVANRALAPGGVAIPAGTAPGEDLVNAGLDAIDDMYRRALPPNTQVNYTPAMRAEMQAIGQNAEDLLDDAGMRMVRREIAKITQPGSSGGTGMTGERAQQVLSELRRMQRRYAKPTATATENNVGDVLGQIEDVFQRQLENSVPDGQAVRDANRAYANWLRVEGASGLRGADEGLFTGPQMLGEVRRQARNPRDFARGTAPMKQEAQAGKSVLANRVPDSGTPFRTIAAGSLLAGGGAASGAGLVDPLTMAAAATALGVPSLAYTRPGQAVLANLIAGRQGPNYQSIAEMVRRFAPGGGRAAAPLATEIMR